MPVEPEAWKKIMSNSLGGGKPGHMRLQRRRGADRWPGWSTGFAEAIDRDLGVRPFAFTTSKNMPPAISSHSRSATPPGLFKQIAPNSSVSHPPHVIRWR